MIDVLLNGERKSIEERQTLSAVLVESGFNCMRIAVAVNGEFVPRSSYESFFLKPNDEVDVVAPVAGG